MSQSFGPLEDASETLFVAEAWKVSGKCVESTRELLCVYLTVFSGICKKGKKKKKLNE